MVAKIFWLLFPPCNLIVLLLLAGWIAGRWHKITGRGFLITSLGLFIVAGLLPTGTFVLHELERDYPPRAILPAKIDGILVLGGAFDSRIAKARGQAAFSDSGERVTEATRLMHLYPDAPLVYSDGNGRLDRSLDAETVLFRDYLNWQGLTDGHVRYENRSRNTYENILYSLPLAKPSAGQAWVVVTSAWHMRRATGVMRKQRWPGAIIPDPVDYQTAGDASDFRMHLDVLGNLAAFNLAARECLALLAYRYGGKTDSGL